VAVRSQWIAAAYCFAVAQIGLARAVRVVVVGLLSGIVVRRDDRSREHLSEPARFLVFFDLHEHARVHAASRCEHAHTRGGLRGLQARSAALEPPALTPLAQASESSSAARTVEGPRSAKPSEVSARATVAGAASANDSNTLRLRPSSSSRSLLEPTSADRYRLQLTMSASGPAPVAPERDATRDCRAGRIAVHVRQRGRMPMHGELVPADPPRAALGAGWR
jgi:hypothetical protein